jgi:DNA-binding XRE family transcriptional regulator
MTGAHFKKLREEIGLGIQALADAWEVNEKTIRNLQQMEKVDKRTELAIRAMYAAHHGDGKGE